MPFVSKSTPTIKFPFRVHTGNDSKIQMTSGDQQNQELYNVPGWTQPSILLQTFDTSVNICIRPNRKSRKKLKRHKCVWLLHEENPQISHLWVNTVYLTHHRAIESSGASELSPDTNPVKRGIWIPNLRQDPAPLIHPLTAAALPLRVSSAAHPRLCPCTSPSPSSTRTWWTHLENGEKTKDLSPETFPDN